MKDHNFDLLFKPAVVPDCRVCSGNPDAIFRSSKMDDVAMDLAKHGATYHEIVHVMLAYASIAADRAITWAMLADARDARDNAEAKWDTDHGTEYEDPES